MTVKKLYKTTAFKLSQDLDRFCDITYRMDDGKKVKLFKLLPEIEDWLLNRCSNKNLKEHYLKFFPTEYQVLSRAMAVVVDSQRYPESRYNKKSYEKYLHSAWIMILRADPDYDESEYFDYSGGYADSLPSMWAWKRYGLDESQMKKSVFKAQCREFYYSFDWPTLGKHWEDTKKAWYLNFFEGIPYSKIIKTIGRSSKGTITNRFKKVWGLMEEELKKGNLDVSHELLVLPKEHEIQLNESLYFTYTSWATKKEKQWWCCYACLDWTPEEIAKEWMTTEDKVTKFITKMYRVRAKYQKEHVIPIIKAPRELTIHEVLPDTPRRVLIANKDKKILNNITSKLV